LDDLGKFDFVWIRFVLEYYRTNSFDIVKNISSILKPGGILCMIDLDYNCLSHYGLSPELEKILHSGIKYLEEMENFDPYIGRKLYSFLYDLNYKNIDVDVSAHHLIFGKLRDNDSYNWMKKIEVVSKKFDFKSEEGDWGYDEFLAEFRSFFSDPRRFTYTPIISCRGEKPSCLT
jgi:SAM-dependent methyltransferase